jgi:formylmethanofuran dehydrogenase subunit E
VLLDKLEPPYTCIIDGIQVLTGCTVGNGRLTTDKGKDVAVEFEFEKKTKLRFKVSKEFLNWILDGLKRGEPMERLAYIVAFKPAEGIIQVSEV